MRGLLAPLVKLAVFVLVTVLATSVLAVTIANTDFSDTDTYRARFTDVTSLNAGDDVRISGVKVGEVKTIQIVDKNDAEIAFTVAKDVHVPASVTAQIKYRNLVGQRYVSLEQGVGDPNAVLHPGDVIPIDRTSPSLDLTKLFNGFQPLFQALNPQDINKLSFEVVQVLQGQGTTINQLLASTASLTSKIADKDQVIGKVIDNLNSALTTINAHAPQLSDLIVTVQQLVSGLAADRKPIGDAISSLGELADTTSGFLADARQPLKDDITQLGNLTRNLNKNQPTVEHFIQYLPEKASRLSRLGSYGSWFQFYACDFGGEVTIPGINQKFALSLSKSNLSRCKG